jgi:hypothetical protein
MEEAREREPDWERERRRRKKLGGRGGRLEGGVARGGEGKGTEGRVG